MHSLTAIFSSQVITTIGNLLLVPLFLVCWGPEIYGEWLALFAMVGYLSTLDLGMNMAAGNRLIQAYATGDLETYTQVQHSAMAFYLGVAVAGTLLLGLAAWFFPLHAWLGLRETPTPAARWVLWLLGLQVLWAMPWGLIVGIYRFTGNLARSQWVGNLRLILALSLAALVLWRGGSMTAVAVTQLIPMALTALLVLLHVKDRLPELFPGVFGARLTFVKALLGPSLLFALLILANALTLQGPVLIVSASLGGVGVAVLVTTRTLAALSRQISAGMNVALWPDLTSLEARQDYGRLQTLHRLLVGAASAVTVGLAAALWFEGAEVMAVWTRGKLPPDPVLLKLLLLMIVLQIPWLASATFTAAANRHRRLAWLYLAAGLLGVAVTAILVGPLGAWAVPVGLTTAELIFCSHWVIKDTCRLLQEPYGPFAKRLWPAIALTVVVSLGMGWVVHRYLPGPFLVRWAGVGAATMVAALFTTWTVWLTPADREMVTEKIIRGYCWSPQ